MKAGRLKFEFDENLYAIQVRRVKQEYVWFLVMTLDIDNLDDITAYTIDDSFNLSLGETKEIDIDKDGTNDLIVDLEEIGTINKIRSADFLLKNKVVKNTEAILSNENEI